MERSRLADPECMQGRRKQFMSSFQHFSMTEHCVLCGRCMCVCVCVCVFTEDYIYTRCHDKTAHCTFIIIKSQQISKKNIICKRMSHIQINLSFHTSAAWYNIYLIRTIVMMYRV